MNGANYLPDFAAATPLSQWGTWRRLPVGGRSGMRHSLKCRKKKDAPPMPINVPFTPAVMILGKDGGEVTKLDGIGRIGRRVCTGQGQN